MAIAYIILPIPTESASHGQNGQQVWIFFDTLSSIFEKEILLQCLPEGEPNTSCIISI